MWNDGNTTSPIQVQLTVGHRTVHPTGREEGAYIGAHLKIDGPSHAPKSR